jgi:hypothetical protein
MIDCRSDWGIGRHADLGERVKESDLSARSRSIVDVSAVVVEPTASSTKLQHARKMQLVSGAYRRRSAATSIHDRSLVGREPSAWLVIADAICAVCY